MTSLIILSLLSLAGIGTAIWLFKSESAKEPEETADPVKEGPSEIPSQKKQGSSIIGRLTPSFKKKSAAPNVQDEDSQPQADEVKPPSGGPLSNILSKLNLSRILEKLNFGKKGPESREDSETMPLPSLKDYTAEEKERTLLNKTPTGTASLTTNSIEENPSSEPPIEETVTVDEQESKLPSQLSELQEKYDRLDTLFKEKSNELQSTKESLNNEIKNRSEFNKVKDLLEKELKDSKDKARNIESDGQNIRDEINKHEQRAVELEEKVAQFEKNLVEKESEINDLVKRLQTFANPTTAATLPVIKEEPVPQEEVPSVPEEQPQQSQSDPEPKVSQDQPIQEETLSSGEKTDEPKAASQPEGESAGDPSKADPVNDYATQMGGSSGAEPPEPFEESSNDSDDTPNEEHSFLKLQPDIISDEPKGEPPISDASQKQEPEPTQENQEEKPENNDNEKE